MMPYRSHTRRNSLRLGGYDYTQPGGYFVTIKTHQNLASLGTLEEGIVVLSEQGHLAEEQWQQIPSHFDYVKLDLYTILPDHIHGILIFTAHSQKKTDIIDAYKIVAGSLSVVIRSFKSAVTRAVNEYQQTPEKRFWQRNYHDRIIRSEKSLNQIRRYIENNAEMHWKHIARNT